MDISSTCMDILLFFDVEVKESCLEKYLSDVISKDR